MVRWLIGTLVLDIQIPIYVAHRVVSGRAQERYRRLYRMAGMYLLNLVRARVHSSTGNILRGVGESLVPAAPRLL